MVSYIVISGRSFKNSSVDCDTGSVGLMEATICREGSFSFVRTTYSDGTVEVEKVIKK